jgi:hypothetical protein
MPVCNNHCSYCLSTLQCSSQTAAPRVVDGATVLITSCNFFVLIPDHGRVESCAICVLEFHQAVVGFWTHFSPKQADCPGTPGICRPSHCSVLNYHETSVCILGEAESKRVTVGDHLAVRHHRSWPGKAHCTFQPSAQLAGCHQHVAPNAVPAVQRACPQGSSP